MKTKETIAFPNNLKNIRIPERTKYIAQYRKHKNSKTGNWYAFDNYTDAVMRNLRKTVGLLFTGRIVDENWRKVYKVKTFLEILKVYTERKFQENKKLLVPEELLEDPSNLEILLMIPEEVSFFCQNGYGDWESFRTSHDAEHKLNEVEYMFTGPDSNLGVISKSEFERLLKEAFSENVQIFDEKTDLLFIKDKISYHDDIRYVAQNITGRWQGYSNLHDVCHRFSPIVSLFVTTVRGDYEKNVYPIKRFNEILEKEIVKRFGELSEEEKGIVDPYEYTEPDFVFGEDKCLIRFGESPENSKDWMPNIVPSTNGMVDIDLTLDLAAALRRNNNT